MNIQRAIDWNVSAGNRAGEIDVDLEVDMLEEEFNELKEAVSKHDRVEMLDALIDYMFVSVGTMHKMGLNAKEINGAWEEVCNSNFSKLPFTKDENGKISKGPDFRKPNLTPFVLPF